MAQATPAMAATAVFLLASGLDLLEPGAGAGAGGIAGMGAGACGRAGAGEGEGAAGSGCPQDLQNRAPSGFCLPHCVQYMELRSPCSVRVWCQC